MPRLMTTAATAAVALAALLAAGCAFQSITPGMSREQVVAAYGTPTQVVATGTGSRLQYSGQPLGQFANMVDLDATGKVVNARQVLKPAEFVRIQTGQWTQADMEREFGRPASMDRVSSWSGDIMTYRWIDHDQPMLFWAYLDANRVVQRVGQGMEFPFRDNDK